MTDKINIQSTEEYKEIFDSLPIENAKVKKM